MSSSLKRIAKHLGIDLHKSGAIFATTPTPPTSLRRLIKSLHPIHSGHELIRLGPIGDGGYLVPDDLKDIHALFSPGVNTISGFELDCAERGMHVFMADKSVDAPAGEHPNFSFIKKYIGATEDDDFFTLDHWVNESAVPNDKDLMLQIDIEGFEYETFLSASNSLMSRFRHIVGEFHSVDQLFNKPFFSLAERVFSKILQTHRCVHAHPNNDGGVVTVDEIEIPRVIEFTFSRQDRITEGGPAPSFPHPLDHDNTSKPSVVLPPCWYSNDTDASE